MGVKEEWEAIHKSRTWGIWPKYELLQFLANIKIAVTEREVRLLDLGCAIGASMWPTLETGYDTYGIDISSKVIERAREFLSSKGFPNAKLQVGDFRQLPYEDNFFHFAIDICSIQCNKLEDLPLIFKEVARVMKPGGPLFSIFRASDSWLEPDAPFTQRLSLLQVQDLLNPYFYIRSLEASDLTFGNRTCAIRHHVIIASKKEEF